MARPGSCSTFAVPVGIPVFGLTFTTSNQLIIGGGGGPSRSGVQNKLISYKVEPRRKDLEEEAVYELSNDEDAPMCIDAHPKDDVVIAGINSSEAKIKNGENENCRLFKVLEDKFELTKAMKTIESKSTEEYQKVIRFSTDGTLFATGSSNGQVRVFNYPELDSACNAIECSETDEVMDVDISQEKDKLTFILRDAIKLVNLRGRHAGKVIQTINPEAIDKKQKLQFRVFRYGRHFSKDFAYLVANSPKGGYIVKLNAYTLEHDQIFRASKKAITAFCLSRDGGVLAVASSDYTISLYEANSLRFLYQVKDAHGFSITSLAISPDRRLLASGSADNSCRIIVLPQQFSNATVNLNPLHTVLAAVVVALVIVLITQMFSQGQVSRTFMGNEVNKPTPAKGTQAVTGDLDTTATFNIQSATITAGATDLYDADDQVSLGTTDIPAATFTKDEL